MILLSYKNDYGMHTSVHVCQVQIPFPSEGYNLAPDNDVLCWKRLEEDNAMSLRNSFNQSFSFLNLCSVVRVPICGGVSYFILHHGRRQSV